MNLLVINEVLSELNESIHKFDKNNVLEFHTNGKDQSIVFSGEVLWDSNKDTNFLSEPSLSEYLVSELHIRALIDFDLE